MRRFLFANQSLLIAIAIAAALTLWLFAGRGVTGAAPEPAPPPAVRSTTPELSVRVATITAQPVSRDVVIYGRTEPARAVTLGLQSTTTPVAASIAAMQRPSSSTTSSPATMAAIRVPYPTGAGAASIS